jgi:hypothetical protein
MMPDTLTLKSFAKVASPIILKTEKTILRDLSRYPDSYPELEKIGSGKRKIFVIQKILDFYPPHISALFLSALKRLYENKTIGISIINLPMMKPLADDLNEASILAGRWS